MRKKKNWENKWGKRQVIDEYFKYKHEHESALKTMVFIYSDLV